MTMDYYQILGVDEEASGEEIRSAYRRLVRRYHPDLGGDAEAEKFRRVQEAYETLSDPERRRQYDHTRGTRVPVRIGRPRPASTPGPFPSRVHPFRNTTPEDPLEEIFWWLRRWFRDF